MFDYTVNIKSLPDYLIASVGNPDLDVIEENIRSLKNYYSVLFDHLEQNGVQKSLPQINIAHPTQDDFWKMEVAQMLEKPIPESDLVKVYKLVCLVFVFSLRFSIQFHGSKD